MLSRVSGTNPYVASWQAFGGHTMYVGVYPSESGGDVLLATDQASDAAGFPRPEACAAALLAAGFKLDGNTWLDISPFSGQLGLF